MRGTETVQSSQLGEIPSRAFLAWAQPESLPVMLLPNETVGGGGGEVVQRLPLLPPAALLPSLAGEALGRGQLAAFVAASQEGRSVVCRSVYQLAFLCRSAAVFRGRLPPP